MYKNSDCNAFVESVEAFLKTEFDRRATEKNIPVVQTWDKGWNASLDGLKSYPAVLTFLESKTVVDKYYSSLSLGIAIAFTSDEPSELDYLASCWLDIFEDTLRNGYTLGGSCLSIEDGYTIEVSGASNIMALTTTIQCLVDMGGVE